MRLLKCHRPAHQPSDSACAVERGFHGRVGPHRHRGRRPLQDGGVGPPLRRVGRDAGRVRFGPEGALWLTCDNHNPEIPQSPTMMGSKVLRIQTDGSAHQDERPARGVRPAHVHLRAPQTCSGIAFHPETADQPGHRRAWAVALRRGTAAMRTAVTEAGTRAKHGPARSTARMELRLHAKPDGRHEPVRTRSLHADDRFRDLSRRDAADLQSNVIAESQGISSATSSRAMGRLGWRHGWGWWAGIWPRTPIGQRIDVIETQVVEDAVSVIDVTEMTLPIESARFRLSCSAQRQPLHRRRRGVGSTS